MDDARQAALTSLITGVHRATRVAVMAIGDRTASATRQLLATLHAEGAMSLRDLTLALRIAPPAVSHTVTMLEERGLVTRHPDPDGTGYDAISLTEAGHGEAECWHTQLSDLIIPGLAHLTDDDWTAIAEAASRLASVDAEAIRAAVAGATAQDPTPHGPRPV